MAHTQNGDSSIQLANDGVTQIGWQVNGHSVSRDTYIQLVDEAQQEIDLLRARGWTDTQINALGATLIEDPNSGFPITTENFDREQQELADIQNNITARSQVETLREDIEDWRVRLHLGENADYLYKDPQQMARGSILAPLVPTDGIIFPYTPEIAIQYNANYENYDLVHSNYRGYFYRGSQVQNILLTATFTANDVIEADYLLASLHFLRTCTKMFYGNDVQRGMPPPIVFLTGLGEYHFNNHPCAITMVNYNLPNDVDYIACGHVIGINDRNYPTEVPESKSSRLRGAGIEKGAEKPAPRGQSNPADNNGPIKIYEKATYVPTKISLNFAMIPIQTREQISKGFSLAEYASGKLLKKGYW